MYKARGVIVVVVVWRGSIRVTEVLYQNWHVNQLLFGILEVQLEESVSLVRKLVMVILYQIKELELAIILCDDAKRGHHLYFLHVHRARRQVIV